MFFFNTSCPILFPANVGIIENSMLYSGSFLSNAGEIILKIVLNGEILITDAETLEQLCEIMGYADTLVATAVNGEFVSQDMRKHTTLTENDSIEIVSPRQGG